MSLSLEDILAAHYRQFEELAVSPDDRDILVVMGNYDMPHEEYAYGRENRSIWNCSLTGESREILLASSDEDAHAPCWSPDGSRIAYFSRLSGRTEVWIMNRDGSDKKQVSHSRFPGEDPFSDSKMSWSQDGRTIVLPVHPGGGLYGLFQSFRAQERQADHIQVDGPADSPASAYDKAKSVFAGSLYKLDIATGEWTELASEKGIAFTIVGWLDDGGLLVALGPDMKKVNVDTGEVHHFFSGKKGLRSAQIRGKDLLLAYRGKDQTVEIGRYSAGAYERQLQVRVPGYSVTPHAWSADGLKLFVTAQQGVANRLYAVSLTDGHVEPLTEDGRVVYSPEQQAKAVSLRVGDSVIFPYSGPREPMELWQYASGERRRVSRFNRQLEGKAIPQVRIVKYPSDGWTIEALLVLPPHDPPKGNYPTLVFLHGGPESLVGASFSDLISARAESAAHCLASRGYAVLLPNFRGGSGYGEAFQSEIGSYKIMDKPVRDVMAGVDYLVREGIADPDRLGIYGSSFGAQLAAWTVGRTDRFKGAVGAVGVHYDALFADRYHGNPFLTLFKTRRGSAEKTDPWLKPHLLRSISPIEYIQAIRTPVMLIETGGERKDGWSYARPFYHGLRAVGTECYMVYFPEAFHNGGWNDDYKKDYMQRLSAWFDYCLQGIPLPDWFRVPSNE